MIFKSKSNVFLLLMIACNNICMHRFAPFCTAIFANAHRFFSRTMFFLCLFEKKRQKEKKQSAAVATKIHTSWLAHPLPCAAFVHVCVFVFLCTNCAKCPAKTKATNLANSLLSFEFGELHKLKGSNCALIHSYSFTLSKASKCNVAKQLHSKICLTVHKINFYFYFPYSIFRANVVNSRTFEKC